MRMNHTAISVLVLCVALAPSMGCSKRNGEFAAMQERGAHAMGVDQYTSRVDVY